MVTAFVAFNARRGLLGPYWFEEAGKTVIVNAVRYRDVITNLTQDYFYDDLSEPSLRANSAWPGSCSLITSGLTALISIH